MIKNLMEIDLFPEPFPVRVIHSTDRTFQYPAHWHKAAEVALAYKMDSDIYINNRKYTLKEGDLVYIAGGDIHSYPVCEGCERVIILFDLQGIDAADLWREEYPLNTRSVIIKKNRNESLYAEIIEQIGKMLEEARDIKPGSRFVLLARIYDLIALIIRNTSDAEELRGNSRKELLCKIGRVVEYLEKNYMESITLKSAAEKIGFSEYYLSRVFKRAIGSPFHMYLNRIRMKHAEHKIMTSGESISEIAFSCGFNSIPTFNRLFREIKGCTPLQYRKMQVEHGRRQEGEK